MGDDEELLKWQCTLIVTALLHKLRPQDAMSEIDFTQAVMQMRR
jgi:hypothetical protein